MKTERFLAPHKRAEDIILGGLGFDETAEIIFIQETQKGFKGIGAFKDGTEFEFENEDALTELEIWALQILTSKKAVA